MACVNCQSHKLKSSKLFVRFFSLSFPLLLFLSWLTTTINRLYLVFSGQAAEMTIQQRLYAEPVAPSIISIIVQLPDPLAEVILANILFVGFLQYILLSWVCESQWVQERVQVKECWEEVTWYNPWSWVKALVCTFVEVLKWVLQQICGWKEIFVIIQVAICITVAIIVVLI